MNLPFEYDRIAVGEFRFSHRHDHRGIEHEHHRNPVRLYIRIMVRTETFVPVIGWSTGTEVKPNAFACVRTACRLIARPRELL